MVVCGRMQRKKLPAYVLAQLSGALLAGLTLYFLFSPTIAAYEASHHIIRGTAASMKTAAMFGEYYTHPDGAAVVSLPLAIATEAFGTFLLVLMIFALTEGCNVGRPHEALAPVFIGLSVTSIICLAAPLTQAGLNPARDFGPRMVAWMMGWGNAAFPDQEGGFFLVYILGPILGAVAAVGLFILVLEKLMNTPKTSPCSCSHQG